MDPLLLPSFVITSEGNDIVTHTRPPRPRTLNKSSNSILFRGSKNHSLTINVKNDSQEEESAEDASPMSPISTISEHFGKMGLPNSSTVKKESQHDKSPPLITINAEASSLQETSPSQKTFTSESSSPYKTPKRSNSAPTIVRKQRSLSASVVSPSSERGYAVSNIPPTMTLCSKKRKTLPKPELQAGAKEQAQDDMSFDIEYKFEAMPCLQEEAFKVTLPTLKSNQHPDLHCISPQTVQPIFIMCNYF